MKGKDWGVPTETNLNTFQRREISRLESTSGFLKFADFSFPPYIYHPPSFFSFYEAGQGYPL